jgi:peptide deformylase
MGMAVPDYPALAPEALRGSPRPITVVGDDVLERRCQEVTELGTPELSALIDDMFLAMYVAEGVGLAANQIGVGLRVFVYDCPDGDGARHVGHIVNPVIDPPRSGAATDHGGEGCLSVPGPVRDVTRQATARVTGVDSGGRPVVLEGSGYFARCLAHETDHLDGRLYIDLLNRRERKSALAEMDTMVAEIMTQRSARAAALATLRQ